MLSGYDFFSSPASCASWLRGALGFGVIACCARYAADALQRQNRSGRLGALLLARRAFFFSAVAVRSAVAFMRHGFVFPLVGCLSDFPF